MGSSGQTIVVLGGGGTMGAFQAGALQGLTDVGILPDRLIGCSAGALNAAFLAAAPGRARAAELAEFWVDPRTHAVLSPGGWERLRGLTAVLRSRGQSLLDQRPLRALVGSVLTAHDVGELAVPLTVTTTCLDCQAAVHHSGGPLGDVLLASCALPGLFAPVRLPDGHLHVDGGIVCGVPVEAALAVAGPDDRVLVLDCGFGPVTCTSSDGVPGSCGLGGERDYVAPAEEGTRTALDITLRSFTVARNTANRLAVAAPLADPRVRVLPHVSDAYRAGILGALPRGPRDFTRGRELLAAGRDAALTWLRAGGLDRTVAEGLALRTLS